ncbi:MAG: hypothetical protein ABIP75_15890 [Pyrinomonadaceae bacterium]
MRKQNRNRPRQPEISSRGRRGNKKFQLDTRSKILLGLLVAGFLAVFAVYLWTIAEISRETSVASCLASAYASLEQLGPAPVRNVVTPGYEWQDLSDWATDQLFAMAHPRNCDGINPKPPLLDRWGNRIGLAVRKQPSGQLDFKLTSSGPDGKRETKDDLVFPRSPPSDLGNNNR